MMGKTKKPSHCRVKLILLSVTLLVCLVTHGESGPPVGKHPENVNSSVEDVGKSESVNKSKEVVKRSAEEDSEEEYATPRDNYPMIISKKSATVLNKLVTALRNSMDQNVRSSDFLREKELLPLRNSANYEMFNLQRRNQKDRKNYLRCYFNAVSCF